MCRYRVPTWSIPGIPPEVPEINRPPMRIPHKISVDAQEYPPGKPGIPRPCSTIAGQAQSALALTSSRHHMLCTPGLPGSQPEETHMIIEIIIMAIIAVIGWSLFKGWIS